MLDASFVKEMERLAQAGLHPGCLYEDAEERVYHIPGSNEPLRIRKYIAPPPLELCSAVDLVEALARHAGVKPENLLGSRVHEREATA